MRSQVVVKWAEPSVYRFDLEEVQPMPHDQARAWLDEQFALPRSQSHYDWMVAKGYAVEANRDGFNLIGCAAAEPAGRYVGFDLSTAAIGRGQGAVACESGDIGFQGFNGGFINADQFRNVLVCHLHRGPITTMK